MFEHSPIPKSEFWNSKCADPVYVSELRNKARIVRGRYRSASLIQLWIFLHLFGLLSALVFIYTRTESSGILLKLLTKAVTMVLAFCLCVDIVSFIQVYAEEPLKLTSIEMSVVGVKEGERGFELVDENKKSSKVDPPQKSTDLSNVTSSLVTTNVVHRRKHQNGCSGKLSGTTLRYQLDSSFNTSSSPTRFSFFSSPEKSAWIPQQPVGEIPSWCPKIRFNHSWNTLAHYRNNLIEWMQRSLVSRLVNDQLEPETKKVWMKALPEFKSYVTSKLNSINNKGILRSLKEEKNRSPQMESLPFESEILFCLWCGYFDGIVFRSLPNERPFSDRFVLNTFRPENFHPVCYRNEKTKICILKDDLGGNKMPVYGFLRKGEQIRTNTHHYSFLDAIIGFLYIVKEEWNGWIDQLNLKSEKITDILEIFSEREVLGPRE
ncbi:hypothetical protein ACOME3_000668 [Neoechinorhynchus agilis]